MLKTARRNSRNAASSGLSSTPSRFTARCGSSPSTRTAARNLAQAAWFKFARPKYGSPTLITRPRTLTKNPFEAPISSLLPPEIRSLNSLTVPVISPAIPSIETWDEPPPVLVTAKVCSSSPDPTTTSSIPRSGPTRHSSATETSTFVEVRMSPLNSMDKVLPRGSAARSMRRMWCGCMRWPAFLRDVSTATVHVPSGV